MTDLIVRENNLPTTPEDLSAFVLIGRDKLQAVRAEISAMKNLNLAREVREQKLREGQEIGKLVLLAEARLGELFNQMPKQSGARTDLKPLPTAGNKLDDDSDSDDEEPHQRPKLKVAKELGFNKNQVSQFQKLADNPDAVQEAIDYAEDNDTIATRAIALMKVKQAKKETRQEERRERKAYTPPTELPADIKLIRADIRDGLAEIADNSVDIIITDPPYPKEYLPLYADLSKVAARVLKDGGSLICMTGQSYLPDVINLLASALNYQWCLCYLTPGAKTQIWARHVQTVWKPLLWFVKGQYNGDWLGVDAVLSDKKDKHFHDWGQSFNGIKGIIEAFTNPDDVVLDPFLGGGTTAVAAVTVGRKFIGVDIEQSCIDTTKSRITEEFDDGNRCDDA